MKVSVSETISGPVQTVFDAVSDVTNAADLISGLDKVEILSDVKTGKGLRWRETRVMFGKESTEEMEITVFDPPNFYRSEARSHGMIYLTNTTFREIDENTTEVTVAFTGTPVSLVAKLMTPIGLLFSGSLKKSLRADLLDLKRSIEH